MRLFSKFLFASIIFAASDVSYSGLGDLLLKMQVKKFAKQIESQVALAEKNLGALDENNAYFASTANDMPEFFLSATGFSVVGLFTFGIPGISTYGVTPVIAFSWSRSAK